MSPIQFGILMIPYQTLDVAGPTDLIFNCSKEIIANCRTAGIPLHQSIKEGIDIKFHHINTTSDPVELTSGFRALPTTTCDDCPPLDFLLCGGPDPFNFSLDERFAEFVRAHVKTGKTLFTTCTGAWALGASGVLDGKNATVNHEIIGLAIKDFPQVNWTKEKQWVIDGNIWTSGGPCAGMDMMAHWVIENFGIELASFGLRCLDFEPRDVDGNRLFPQLHGVVTA